MQSFTTKKLISSLFLTISLSSTLFLLPISPTKTVVNTAYAVAKTDNGLGTTESEERLKKRCASWTGIRLGDCLVLVEYWLMVGVPRWIFHLAAKVFDTLWAFGLSSNTFSLDNTTDNFVNIGWVVCRDVANTFFIFILLYIAIMTIIGQLGGNLKSFLSTLIVVALLINFSMFITRFVVDVGNVFAIEFYSTFPPSANYTACPPLTFDGIEEHCISEGFMNALLNPVFNLLLRLPDQGTVVLRMVAVAFTGLEILVVTFIFLISSFLLLGRVVAIWILMILAPLAFFSHILPYFKGKIWGPWLSHLIAQTFFPAIFLFFIYLAARIAQGNSWLINMFNASKTPEVTTEALLRLGLQFATINFFLIYGMKLAKDMSGQAGAMASKFGVGAVLGGTAIVGRKFIGRAANWAQNTQTAKQLAANSKIARYALKNTVGRAAEGSWDARSSSLGGSLIKTIGADVGQAGGQGGYVGQRQVAAREILGGYNALKGDPKMQAQYAASLEKFGGRGMQINADQDTKALMSQLTVQQQNELIDAAKGTKNEEYLKQVRKSLAEDMTPGQQIEAAKAEFELKKTDPRAMADYAEMLHKEGKDSYLAPMTKGLSAKEWYDMESSATGDMRTTLKTTREEAFAKLKPIQRAQMEKDFVSEQNLGDFKASMKNYQAATEAKDAKLKEQYEKEVGEKFMNLRSQQIQGLDGNILIQNPVARNISEDTVRGVLRANSMTEKEAKIFRKNLGELSTSEAVRNLAKYGPLANAKEMKVTTEEKEIHLLAKSIGSEIKDALKEAKGK
jgi:hypothetical protein